MTASNHEPTALDTLREEGLVRPRDLEELGIPRGYLERLVEKGKAKRLARGLYRIEGAEVTEHHLVAAVTKKVPQGIICLTSALAYHRIGTQIPHEVWIAIDRKARKPELGSLPVRVVRFSRSALTYAVDEITIEGVPTRVPSPARTVVDCFRYRSKIGIDIAIEVLEDALGSRLASVDEILRAAEMCRAMTVIYPFLEARC